LITCLLLPLNVLTSEQELVYRFNRKPWKYNLLTILRALVNIGAGVILVVNLKWGVLGAQLASLISSLFVVIFSFLFYTRNKYTYKFSFTWAKKMLKYGFPLVIGGIAVWVYSVSDRYFLLFYKNLQDIGYYSIGSTFSQPIGILNTAVQMSWGVLFYEIYNKEGTEKKESKQALIDTINYYTIFVCFIALFLSLFAYEIVKIVATPKFLPGIIVIPFLLFSAILAQIIEIIGIGITISEKTIYFTYIVIVSSLVNLGLNFIFIPLLSYLGAAVTTIIAYIINFILTFKIAQKYFPVRFNMLKLSSFYFLFLLIASIVPLFEIKGIINFSIYFKIMVFSFAIFIPFAFKLMNFHQLFIIIRKNI